MPDINLGTLALIPGLAGLTAVAAARVMEQTPGSNLCGAYALVAAVGAYGPIAPNTVLTYSFTAAAGRITLSRKTAALDPYRELGRKVYDVTGILNIGPPLPPPPLPPPAVVPELLENGNVYNSPAAMAKVAKDLGRAPRINALTDGILALGALYPGEQARCLTVVGAPNIKVDHVSYDPPVAETHIVCVYSGMAPNFNLHWLARGSNGLYYDPRDGTLNNNWGGILPRGYLAPIGPYFFAGLWIVIS